MLKLLWKSGCLTKIIIVLLTVLTVLFVQRFPAWISAQLLPALAQSAGVAGLEADVSSLGLTGAELSNARIRIEGKRTVSVDMIKVSYRLPLYPFKRQIAIKSLLINGLKINVVEENGAWKIPGIYPELFDGKKENPPAPKTTKSSDSIFTIERLLLRNCELRIEKDGRKMSLPFSGRVNLPRDLNKPIRVNVNLQFSGDQLHVFYNWHRKTQLIEMETKGSLRFDNYTSLFPQLQRKFYGEAEFTAKLSGSYPKTLAGTISFPKLLVGSKGWRLGVTQGTPALITYTQLSANHAEFSLNGLNVYRPVSCQISPLGGSVSWSPKIMALQSSLRTTFPAEENKSFRLGGDISIDHQINLQWDSVGQKGEWHYNSSISDNNIAKIIDGQFEKIELSSSGELNGKNIEMRNEIAIHPALDFKAGKIKAKVTAPSVKASMKLNEGAWSGMLTLNSPQISLPSYGVTTGKLALEYPLFAPGNGFFELNQIQYGQHLVEQLKYQINSDGPNITLDGNIKQSLLPDLNIVNRIKLQTSPQLTANAELKVTTAIGAKPVNLGKFNPSLDGMIFNASINLDGSYRWRPGEQSGDCSLTIANGALSSEKLNLKADDFALGIAFPRLPTLESAPNQYLNCGNLKFKTYNFENIKASFSLDNDRSFLLENFGLNWSGGKVFTHSLRFAPDTKNLNAIIYLDGLNISQIISQTGLAKAAGDGAIYGRIPLQVGVDGINIRPGFLYSVPGKTRNLKVEGLEDKLSSIPKETAQFAQLDLANEALKNFNYEWIKVDFDNDGDNLVIKSQFNGRPVNPLPFTYDAKSGRIVRMEGALANFQGINLDLNTTLPLNQLLNLNQNIRNLFGGKKK